MPINKSNSELVKIIIQITLIMFAIESFIMFLFWFVELEINWFIELLVDSTVLAVLSSSIIYKYIISPFVISRDNAYKQAHYLAHHDELTGLYNRRSLMDYLNSNKHYKKNSYVALLLIDIDDFKKINDTHGHLFGDAVLKEVSNRLKDVLRENDQVLSDLPNHLDLPDQVISRHGGDEFLVLLSNLKNIDDASLVAERIISKLSENSLIKNISISIKCSVGLSINYLLRDSHVISEIFFETMMHQADVALYYVKNHGKKSYKIFEPDLEAFFSSMTA